MWLLLAAVAPALALDVQTLQQAAEAAPGSVAVAAADDATWRALRPLLEDGELQLMTLGGLTAEELRTHLGLDCLLVVEGEALRPTGQCGEDAPSAPEAPPAPAATSWLELVDDLVARPPDGRSARLSAALGAAGNAPETASRLASGLVVSDALARGGRGDPTVVRWFLRAALCSDEAVRARAQAAATTGGDPPLVDDALLQGGAVGGAVGVAPAATEPVPAVAVAPPAAPHPAPVPATLREYSRQRLARSGVSSVALSTWSTGTSTYATASTVHGWAVRDGTGTVLSPIAFCERVGDSAGCARIRKRATTWSVGGGAAAVVGVTWAAAAVSRDRFVPGEIVASSALAGTGTAFLALGLFTPNTWSLSGYREGQVDAKVEAYNARLRDRLGLTEEDVAEIDLRGPTGRLRLEPFVGPGVVGLAGAF